MKSQRFVTSRKKVKCGSISAKSWLQSMISASVRRISLSYIPSSSMISTCACMGHEIDMRQSVAGAETGILTPSWKGLDISILSISFVLISNLCKRPFGIPLVDPASSHNTLAAIALPLFMALLSLFPSAGIAAVRTGLNNKKVRTICTPGMTRFKAATKKDPPSTAKKGQTSVPGAHSQ